MRKRFSAGWQHIGMLALWMMVVLGVGPVIGAQLLPQGQQQFFGNDGKPLVGGQVYFYVPSTTTAKTTWQDSGGVTPNTNPVILDAYGRATIFGTGQYRQILKTSTGTTIWDKVVSDYSQSSVFYGGASGGTANVVTLTASGYTHTSGQLVFFVATNSNTTNTTLNINSYGAVPVVKDSASGPTALTGGEIVAGNTVGVIYDGTAGTYHLTGAPVGTLPSLTVSGTLTAGTVAATSLTIDGVSPVASGEVAAFARNTCPAGWLAADGTAVSRTTYANLYAAIGTTWGVGNGVTTFNVPDFRGEFLRGWDNGRGVDTGRTFASTQTDRIKDHWHYVFNTDHDGENATLSITASNYAMGQTDYTGSTYFQYTIHGSNTVPTRARTSSAPSGTSATETAPRNVAVLYCLRY